MFGDRLKKVRIDKGLTLESLADLYNKRFDGGLNKGTLSKYENNKQEPMISVVNNLSKILNVSVDYLLCRTDIDVLNRFPSVETYEYKIIGEIAAGYDSSAIEQYTDNVIHIPSTYISKGYSPSDYFVLKIKGNSMYPKFIDGDNVLVLRCKSVDSGSIAVVLYNGNEATVKKVIYKTGEDWLDLVPTNPEYQTKRIENSDLEECRVLGKVVALFRNV